MRLFLRWSIRVLTSLAKSRFSGGFFFVWPNWSLELNVIFIICSLRWCGCSTAASQMKFANFLLGRVRHCWSVRKRGWEKSAELWSYEWSGFVCYYGILYCGREVGEKWRFLKVFMSMRCAVILDNEMLGLHLFI